MTINRILWPFAVNWREPYEVTHSFKTDIFTRAAGTEMRVALRRTPRKSITQTITAKGETLRRFNRLVTTGQNMQVILPEITRSVTLVAPLAVDGVALPFAEDKPEWLRAGAEVIVGKNSDRRVGLVEAVTADTITLAEPIGAFAQGSPIYLALTGRFAADQAMPRMTNSVAEGRVTFNVDPGSEIISTALPGTLFGTREVFERPHNWIAGQDVTHQWPTEKVDYDSGVFTVHSPIDFPTIMRGGEYLLRSREDAEAAVSFFHRMRGRRGEFMRSSGEPDLIPVGGVAAAGVTLLIAGTETFETYLDDPVHRAVEVRVGGLPVYRLIVGMALVGDNTEITVDLPWGVTGEASRVSWLYNSRLASDDMTVTWLNDRVAQITMASLSLPLADGFDYTALRATPAGEDREIPDGSDRIVLYV